MKIVAVRNLTRQRVSCVSFEQIAKTIAPGWEISLVFIGATRARNINISTRGKNYIPNVLSYTVRKNTGEILICPTQAKKEAKKFAQTHGSFILFLFIHALLHLKGYRHGITMEQYEHTLLSRFTKQNKRAHQSMI